jgi:aspartyl protease
MRTTVGVLLASLLWPACADSVPAPSEIPFDFSTRQPIVQARVNGGQQVPFVVDTGASIHLIDDGVAAAAELASGAARRMSGGGEAGFEARFAAPLTLEVSGVRWEGQRAAVTRLGYPDQKHFAGILGAPVLMRYAVQIDYAKQVIRLLDPATYAPPSGATLVPFELQDDLPVVSAAVDAGSGPLVARLTVDTGASQFVDLNRPFVDRHGLVDAIPDAAAVARPGLGGSAPVLYGSGRRVTLGGIDFERPRLGLSRARSGSSSRDERDGIIGNELLRHFRVTFDYRRRLLVLEK